MKTRLEFAARTIDRLFPATVASLALFGTVGELEAQIAQLAPAETVAYDDCDAKDCVVHDGDVILFRFNV